MALGLFVWMALAVTAGRAVGRMWSSFSRSRAFYWAIAPGVIVHETSLAVACLLTGAKISRIGPVDRDGSVVSHGSPRLPLIGGTIVALLPVAGSIAALWGTWAIFAERLGLDAPALPELNFSSWELLTKLSIKGFFEGGWALIERCFADVYSMRMLSGDGLGFLYLLLCFSIVMAPGGDDIKRTLLTLLAAAVVVTLLMFASLWGTGADAAVDVLRDAISAAMTGLAMAVAVSMPIAAACKIAGK